MLFTNGKKQSDLHNNDSGTLQLDGIQLEFVNHFTYLGIIIDDDLRFTRHINHIISSSNWKLTTLSKIRFCITENIAVLLYKALILSILDYGDVFYDCAAKKDLDKLQKLQNRALRIANQASRYTRNIDLHRRYKIVPLYMHREKNIQKLIHTYLSHNLEDVDFPWDNEGLDNTLAQSSIVTRQMSAPFVPLKHPNSTRYKNSCAFRWPQLWLELPISFRREANYQRFKLLLKIKSRSDLEVINSVYR